MKTKEEIQDQINLYDYYIKQWKEENETFYWYEIKISERIIQELRWVLGIITE